MTPLALYPRRTFIRLAATQLNSTTSGAGAAAARAGGGGGGGAAARMAAAAYNDLYARYFNLSLALGVAVLLLFAAPLYAGWLASGRLMQGWMLGGKKNKSKEEVWGLGSDRAITMSSTPVPMKIRVVSGWWANWRYFYNRLLLPSVPLVHFTVGQVLVCLIYQAIVLAFLFLQAGDLKSNYRRPGYIAVAQIPAVFLLATKNSLISIVGKSYEKLNFLHRLAGRMLVLCALLHTVFYVIAFPFSLKSPTILTGCVASIALGLTAITSTVIFRNTFYQVFLISHIMGWITFIVAVNYHTEVARPYIYVAIGAYGLDILVRIVKTRFRTATLMALSGGMSMLQVHDVAEGWRPGQHVWIRVFKGCRMLEAHPFTAANAPASASPLIGQRNLTLLAKSTGDWTRALNSAATMSESMSEKDGFGFGRTVRLSIEGPYGGPMLTDFADSQAVLLVAGGSGITFAASILEELIGQACKGGIRTRSITLIWSIRDIACVDWYQEMFNGLLSVAQAKTSLAVRIKLHITRPSRANYCPIAGASLFQSRPDMSGILSDVVEDVLQALSVNGVARGGGIAVGCCGPRSLVGKVRQAVAGVGRAKAVQTGGIVCHSETFGW